MDMISVGSHTSLAIVAYLFGLWASIMAIGWVQTRNRSIEWKANEKADIPGRQQLAWGTIHIRDDVGSLTALVATTNGLLLAILVVLIVR